MVPEARSAVRARRFSFNVKGGRCETCAGQGTIKVEMNFSPTFTSECEDCGGKGTTRRPWTSLQGEDISDVMSMSFREGLELFSSISSCRVPQVLQRHRADYLTSGRRADPFGRQAQRINWPGNWDGATDAPLHLDEPTTGLHMATRTACSRSSAPCRPRPTVIVIEHNLDSSQRRPHHRPRPRGRRRRQGRRRGQPLRTPQTAPNRTRQGT